MSPAEPGKDTVKCGTAPPIDIRALQELPRTTAPATACDGALSDSHGARGERGRDLVSNASLVDCRKLVILITVCVPAETE